MRRRPRPGFATRRRARDKRFRGASAVVVAGLSVVGPRSFPVGDRQSTGAASPGATTIWEGPSPEDGMRFTRIAKPGSDVVLPTIATDPAPLGRERLIAIESGAARQTVRGTVLPEMSGMPPGSMGGGRCRRLARSQHRWSGPGGRRGERGAPGRASTVDCHPVRGKIDLVGHPGGAEGRRPPPRNRGGRRSTSRVFRGCRLRRLQRNLCRS